MSQKSTKNSENLTDVIYNIQRTVSIKLGTKTDDK